MRIGDGGQQGFVFQLGEQRGIEHAERDVDGTAGRVEFLIGLQHHLFLRAEQPRFPEVANDLAEEPVVIVIFKRVPPAPERVDARVEDSALAVAPQGHQHLAVGVGSGVGFFQQARRPRFDTERRVRPVGIGE